LGQHAQHAQQQSADQRLPGKRVGGQHASIRGAVPEASMISSNAARGIMPKDGAKQPDRLGLTCLS
jgi:hypothetical protein